MHTLTHALLPVVALSVDRKRTNEDGVIYWNWRKLLLVAVAGALPDLLNPHLSLQARYSSWSHGLPALCVFSVILLLIWLLRQRKESLFFIVMAAAYEMHLWCDLISGGIVWQYPLGNDVIGAYYISARWWVPLDIACVLAVYFIYRAIPNFRKWRELQRRKM